MKNPIFYPPATRRTNSQLAKLAGLALAVALTAPPLMRADGGFSINVNLPGAELSVGTPPPAPREEIIVGRPSDRHVWIAGYWRWHRDRYEWIHGHWELPPREHAVYVAPHWASRDGRYVLVEGYWRDEQPVAAAPVMVVTTPPPTTQPEVVVPAAAPQQEVVSVQEAPPPPVQEVISDQPSPLHVWIGGHWIWKDSAYLWLGGHWELPPQPGVAYAVPHWEFHHGRYHFVEGGWQAAPTPPAQVSEVIVEQAPPAPRHEVIPERPSPGHLWIAGHWAWHDNRQLWVRGRWELPPREGAVYVQARWESRGGRFVFVDGFWR